MCFIKLSAYCLIRFCRVRSIKSFTSYRCLLVLDLFKQIYHELVTIMLQGRFKLSPNKSFDLWIDNIIISLTTSAIDLFIQLIKLITIFKVRSSSFWMLELNELLKHKVISQLMNWYQALQASIHVAVECVIVKTYDTIFKSRQLSVLRL